MSSYMSTRSNNVAHSTNLVLILDKFFSFKTLAEIVEEEQNEGLKFKEQRLKGSGLKA